MTSCYERMLTGKITAERYAAIVRRAFDIHWAAEMAYTALLLERRRFCRHCQGRGWIPVDEGEPR